MKYQHGKRVMAVLMAAALGASWTARAEDGAASPEELAKKFQELSKGRKMSALVPLVHPDDRSMLAFGAFMMAGFSAVGAKDQDAAQKELEAIQTKHGVKEGPKDQPPAQNDAEMTMRMRLMYKDVDVVAYCKALEAYADKYADKSKPEEAGGPTKIDEIKVNGDEATVTMDGKPGHLTKLNGRWYLRMK
ncbi:MAG: hypothetical protein U0166_02570 [Acidobacteriota bacterium]